MVKRLLGGCTEAKGGDTKAIGRMVQSLIRGWYRGCWKDVTEAIVRRLADVHRKYV